MAEKVSDGLGSYNLMIRAMREEMVRRGEVQPINKAERQQKAEGFRGYENLDCVRMANGVGDD